MPRPIRVHYYRIHDRSYPRNSRIRRHLASSPTFALTEATPSTAKSRLRRLLIDVLRLWRAARSSDVLVLSELRLAHAPIVSVVGRLTNCVVVVDGFVGLHETIVGDWGHVPPRSLRARLLAMQDRLALAGADVFLIDTAARADAVAETVDSPPTIVALPVGAPSWATALPEREPDATLRILYYGNYIPLHGLDVVVEAAHRLGGRRPFHLTMIGDGELRPAIEAEVTRLGMTEVTTFVDPVPENELATHIADADIILGIFGTSPKARGVVANKVWQGLACGRVVVTADSTSVRELSTRAGSALRLVPAGDAARLAEALALSGSSTWSSSSADADVATALECWVDERFHALDDALVAAVDARSNR